MILEAQFDCFTFQLGSSNYNTCVIYALSIRSYENLITSRFIFLD